MSAAGSRQTHRRLTWLTTACWASAPSPGGGSGSITPDSPNASSLSGTSAKVSSYSSALMTSVQSVGIPTPSSVRGAASVGLALGCADEGGASTPTLQPVSSAQ